MQWEIFQENIYFQLFVGRKDVSEINTWLITSDLDYV